MSDGMTMKNSVAINVVNSYVNKQTESETVRADDPSVIHPFRFIPSFDYLIPEMLKTVKCFKLFFL